METTDSLLLCSVIYKFVITNTFNCHGTTAYIVRRTAARQREEIKECFTNLKQVFLLYHWGTLVTLEPISLIPLVGSPEANPLVVKYRLYI